ncbi:hypothetical protein [Bacillus manliponensis]|uniref:hypothetical protein n=1 Tax=Bacillus manliponensis TaxID=574376 RepID=UPI003515BF55
MIGTLQFEFKRAFSSTSFFISLLLGIAIFLAHFFNHVLPWLNGDFTPFNKWIGMDTFSFQLQLLLLICPIIVALPFSDSYFTDKKSGFLKAIYVRTSKINYIITKLFVNFIIGGLVYVVPFLLSLWAVVLLFPSVKPDPMTGTAILFDGQMWADIYYSEPYAYILRYLVIIFLYGGLFATIGLAISVFCKNRFVVLVAPFLLYLAMFFIFQLISLPEYIPAKFLSPGQEVTSIRFSVIVMEFVVLLFVSISVFVLGAYKSETD